MQSKVLTLLDFIYHDRETYTLYRLILYKMYSPVAQCLNGLAPVSLRLFAGGCPYSCANQKLEYVESRLECPGAASSGDRMLPAGCTLLPVNWHIIFYGDCGK